VENPPSQSKEGSSPKGDNESKHHPENNPGPEKSESTGSKRDWGKLGPPIATTVGGLIVTFATGIVVKVGLHSLAIWVFCFGASIVLYSTKKTVEVLEGKPGWNRAFKVTLAVLLAGCAIIQFLILKKPAESSAPAQSATAQGSNSTALNQSAVASGSNSGVIQAGPNSTVNSTRGDNSPIIQFTQYVHVQAKDYIPGTEYTHGNLDKAFPFGYAVIYGSQNKRYRYEVITNKLMDWTFDLNQTQIEPDFASGSVSIKMPSISGDSTNITIRVERGTFTMPLRKGVFRRAAFYLGSNPVPHLAVLSDNQQNPVFAIGFRIPLPGEGRPPGSPWTEIPHD